MHDLYIIKERLADRKLWLDICANDSTATFFHTPLWAECFSANHVSCARQLVFNDGNSVILPLTYQYATKKLTKVYQSMPACTFGGWLSIDNLTEQHYKVLIDHLQKFTDLTFRENPYNLKLNSIDLKHATDDFTYSINIKQGYEAFWKHSDYSHRKAVKKAEKEGITIIASEDDSMWDAYFDIYQASIDRWKGREIFSGVSYSKDFVKNIRSLSKEYRTLWLAQYDSKIVAGIICFYWNQHAVAWHGAGLENYFTLRPNNLLYNTAIHDACQKGFTWFDCNPSGKIDGVIKFKKYLGAVELRSRVIVKKSLIRKITDLIAKH